MHLIIILIVIVVVGVLVYWVNNEIAMPPVYKKMFNIVAAIGLILWIIYYLGLWPYFYMH